MDKAEDILKVLGLGGGALALVVGVAAVIWFLLNTTTRKTLPVAAVLVGLCLEVFFFKQPSVQVGLQLYPNDAISVFTLLACLVTFVRRPLPVSEVPFLLWLGFGFTIMLSFAIGLQQFGRYAGTEVRPFFYLWVTGLYASIAEFDEKDLKRIARWCVLAGYALIGIAVYFYVAVGIGYIDRMVYFGDEEGSVFRPIGAAGAYYAGALALFQTLAWLRRSGTRFSGLHALVFLAFVVILQHRSVWIAVGAGLLVLLFVERQHVRHRFGLLLGALLAVSMGIAIAASFGVFDELSRNLLQSVSTMDDQHGTFAGRVDGWERLTDEWSGASVWVQLFGYPFGRGYTRYYYGQLIEFAPHNLLLDLVLRVGVIGTLFFLVPALAVIVHGLRAPTRGEVDHIVTRGLGVLMFSSMVYGVAYPTNYLLTMALGVGMAEMMRRSRARADLLRPQALRPSEPGHGIGGEPTPWHAGR